jgi:hypothetical protein
MNFNVVAIKRRYETFVEDILRDVMVVGRTRRARGR